MSGFEITLAVAFELGVKVGVEASVSVRLPISFKFGLESKAEASCLSHEITLQE